MHLKELKLFYFKSGYLLIIKIRTNLEIQKLYFKKCVSQNPT